MDAKEDISMSSSLEKGVEAKSRGKEDLCTLGPKHQRPRPHHPSVEADSL